MQTISLGRINFINVLPVYYALEERIISHNFAFRHETPAVLNDLMREGALDISSCSCIEYARNWEKYAIARDLSISSSGPVMSVLLLSQCPIDELAGTTILLSGQSHTSVILTKLLFADYLDVPVFYIRGSVSDAIRNGNPPKAVLAIGDEALSLRNNELYPYCADLALLWREWTKLPFVFALWIVNKKNCETFDDDPTELIRQSRDWGLSHLDTCLHSLKESPLLTAAERTYYYTQALRYTLGEAEQAGLALFYKKCTDKGFLQHEPPITFFNGGRS
ncbi:MAG: menaquinone biosynthesis protein [Desulfovibrio sp.]|nr:menaquinone biosynthesis protein [Desulfovibrio sp.]